MALWNYTDYWSRILSRTISDTIRFFGWNKQTLILPFLFIVGSYIHLQRFGLRAMMDELGAFISYGLIPVCGFTVLLFIWNLVRVPVLLDKERENEIKELEKQLNTKVNKQKLLDILELLHVSGNVLLIERIKDDKQHEEWGGKNKRWKGVMISIIESNVSKKDATRFDVARTKITPYIYEYNEVHREELSYLEKRIDILEEIIDRIRE